MYGTHSQVLHAHLCCCTGFGEQDTWQSMGKAWIPATRPTLLPQVCAHRSFNVMTIVESLYDMGNLGAVCRTSDGKLSAAALPLDCAVNTSLRQSCILIARSGVEV